LAVQRAFIAYRSSYLWGLVYKMQNFISIFYLNELNIMLAIVGLLITLITMVAVPAHLKLRYKEYYLLNLVYVFSFLVVIFTKDWLVFFVAWEFVTITTSLMLVWKSKGLAGQYFIIQFAGSSMLLFAILMAINNGYSEIIPISEGWLQNLFILGLGMKSAVFGLHFWLPSIYIKSPITFNAISSGWVVKLGFIIMLKIIPQGNQLLLVLGLLMIFYGGIKALKASDFKLLLTYSSISQLGYIAIGIASGTIYGYIGSVLHIIAHGLAKTNLFLACGSFIKEYGSSYIYDFKDAWAKQRFNSLVILLSFASLMGIPLLAGFNSKYLIKYSYNNGFVITIVLYAASLLTALYALRFLYLAIIKDLMGKTKSSINGSTHKLRKVEYLALMFLSVLLLVVGFNAELIVNIVEDINYFKYNFLKGILETTAYLMISIIILWRIDWLKDKKGGLPSLDPLFNKINKCFFQSGRSLYSVIYQDFQYQLLWVPVFMLILFLMVG